jgi:chemotaxis protein methyltransferase WspC
MTQPDFEGLLREAIGLDANSIGSNALDRAVTARMASLKISSSERYWDCLQGSSDELQELIESVVVPETWFFRDPESFSAMVRLLSASFLSASVDRPIRILSVPCCTGEEPYSIAMALLEAGLPGQFITIDAVDVSRVAIVRARRGVYGSNSFRGDDFAFRDRYMESTGERYRMRDDIRRLVKFHQDNLFSDSFRNNGALYDTIFCRNLLIYFDREKQELALEKIKRLLKANGHLFVGPAEAVLASRSGFRSLNEMMSFAFAKDELSSGAKPAPYSPPLKAQMPDEKGPASIPAAPAFKRAIASSRETNTPSSLDPTTHVEIAEIQNLADAGDFERALALCEAHLRANGPGAESCYLRALIHDAKNEIASAVEWYRKVVYLEPQHSEALLHLALLYDRQGNPAAAAQLRRRAKQSGLADGRHMSRNATQAKSQ